MSRKPVLGFREWRPRWSYVSMLSEAYSQDYTSPGDRATPGTGRSGAILLGFSEFGEAGGCASLARGVGLQDVHFTHGTRRERDARGRRFERTGTG